MIVIDASERREADAFSIFGLPLVFELVWRQGWWCREGFTVEGSGSFGGGKGPWPLWPLLGQVCTFFRPEGLEFPVSVEVEGLEEGKSPGERELV